MPPRTHARQRLPLACALACVFLVATGYLTRSERSDGDALKKSGDPQGASLHPVRHRSLLAAASNPRAAVPVESVAARPRWALPRGIPVIPWEDLRGVLEGERKDLDFTFHDGHVVEHAHVRRIERRSETSYTLLGVLPGKNTPGSWSLSRKGTVVVANFRLPDGGSYLEWRLDPQGDPTENEILADLLPACESAIPSLRDFADAPGPTVPRDQAPDANRSKHSLPPIMGDDPVPVPEIAILVVYTPASVAAVGGPSAMEALVYLAIDETNAALADSLALPRLRLVHHQEVTYGETVIDMASDLTRLRTPNDGYLDEVAGLRETVGADLVSLIVVNDRSCGRAYTLVSNPDTFADYAFSTVAHDCVATNYSFSHEVAHNLGCQHAVGDDNGAVVSGQGIFPFAHAWRFNASTPDGTLYRTIMAQTPGLRVPFYSNPDVTVAGAVAGSPSTANCARTISMTAPAASNWRVTPRTLFGDAIEQPGWIFQSGGDAPWTVQPIERRDGADALQVGLVPDGGHSWLQTIREGPVQLDFFWKADFEDLSAVLAVTVDGVEYGRIQGGKGWKRQSVRLATGSHLLRWTQTRGNGGDARDALAWIDGLRVSPVPLVIHGLRTEGVPVGGISIEFESIPFQDYVLEMSSDLRQWRPLSPITPNDPSARSTDFHALIPVTAPPDSRPDAIFRIRMLE